MPSDIVLVKIMNIYENHLKSAHKSGQFGLISAKSCPVSANRLTMMMFEVIKIIKTSYKSSQFGLISCLVLNFVKWDHFSELFSSDNYVIYK